MGAVSKAVRGEDGGPGRHAGEGKSPAAIFQREGGENVSDPTDFVACDLVAVGWGEIGGEIGSVHGAPVKTGKE